MRPIHLIRKLIASKCNLFSIYDDDMVPYVDVRRVARLVLSHQQSRRSRCQTAYRLPAGIDQMPFPVSLGVLATRYERVHIYANSIYIQRTRYLVNSVSSELRL